MPKNSCIKHPANYPWFQVRLEYIWITGRDKCSASVLSLLEFYTNSEYAFDELGWLRGIDKHRIVRDLLDMSKERSVDAAIERLELIGFVEAYRPAGEYIQRLRLNAANIQRALDVLPEYDSAGGAFAGFEAEKGKSANLRNSENDPEKRKDAEFSANLRNSSGAYKEVKKKEEETRETLPLPSLSEKETPAEKPVDNDSCPVCHGSGRCGMSNGACTFCGGDDLSGEPGVNRHFVDPGPPTGDRLSESEQRFTFYPSEGWIDPTTGRAWPPAGKPPLDQQKGFTIGHTGEFRAVEQASKFSEDLYLDDPIEQFITSAYSRERRLRIKLGRQSDDAVVRWINELESKFGPEDFRAGLLAFLSWDTTWEGEKWPIKVYLKDPERWFPDREANAAHPAKAVKRSGAAGPSVPPKPTERVLAPSVAVRDFAKEWDAAIPQRPSRWDSKRDDQIALTACAADPEFCMSFSKVLEQAKLAIGDGESNNWLNFRWILKKGSGGGMNWRKVLLGDYRPSKPKAAVVEETVYSKMRRELAEKAAIEKIERKKAREAENAGKQ